MNLMRQPMPRVLFSWPRPRLRDSLHLLSPQTVRFAARRLSSDWVLGADLEPRTVC